MSKQVEIYCRACVFFEEVTIRDSGEFYNVGGCCHFFPPVLHVPSPDHDFTRGVQGNTYRFVGVSESDWCGQGQENQEKYSTVELLNMKKLEL